jgi:glycerophosphoryl diester phosphodiesterase
MKTPELVAHRGYARHYPENTLIGVEAAIKAGARFIEVDVQLASDEVPMLFHDRTLQRVCGVSGAIHDYPAAQLKNFKAMEFDRFGYRFASEHIATLAELAQLLERYPHVTAFIELKRISIQRFGAVTVLHRVRRELEAVHKRCVVISFDLEALAAARSRWPAIGVVVDRWSERKQHAVAALRPEYLFCDFDGLPMFGKLQFENARVVIYEVDDPTIAGKLFKRGVGFIETFAVGELGSALGAFSKK